MMAEDWLLKRIKEEDDPDKLKKIAETADTKLFGELQDPEKLDMVHVSELAEEAKVLIKNWGKMQGISSGLKAVDYNTRGFVGGELIILAGETSHGKTALGVNMAVNVAKQGKPVLFVSLEITQVQLTARIGKIVGEDALLNLPIFMQKKDELNWRDIDGIISVAKENGVELVIIDHLHYFTREVDKISEDLGRITKEFKKNANRHNIPIVLISHVRKKEGNKMPELSNDALRGSSLIAQDADIVLFVHKVADDRLIVKTTKNRNRGYDFENDTVNLEFIDGALIKDVTGVVNDPFTDNK
jgi:replicative DNA helicase